MPSILHSGHVVHFGYTPNPPHAARLHARCDDRWGAQLDELLAAPDDGGDRYNYRPLVACLRDARISKWLVDDGKNIRLNTYNQGNTSSCTGNARSMQLALEKAQQIVLDGAAELLPAMPAAEVQYAFGLEIDGSLGSDYGCSGSALVEGSEQFGTGFQMLAGSYDLSAGNADGEDIAAWETRLRNFAKNGAPAEVRAFAKNHISASHLRIDTVDQAWAAIGHGYPILVCSNVSYDSKRNEEGIIGRTGSAWPHALCCSSRRTSATYGRLYLIHNSWFANWTTGPYWLDQPIGSFWIAEKDLAVMLACRWSLRQTVRDSWISSGHRGFPRRAELLPQWSRD